MIKFIHKNSSQEGFTIVELIVSMAVITILSGIVFYRSRSGERNLALQRSAQIVLQSIHQAANNTLGGKKHGGTVSQGGYGVHAEVGDNFLTVYADCNGDFTFSNTGTASSCTEAPNEGVAYPEEFRVNTLEPFIEISDLQGDGSINPLDIVFTPPEGFAVVNPLLVTADEAMIEIQNTVEGNRIQIFINKAGATRVVIP